MCSSRRNEKAPRSANPNFFSPSMYCSQPISFSSFEISKRSLFFFFDGSSAVWESITLMRHF